jgi:hypothetical protein
MGRCPQRFERWVLKILQTWQSLFACSLMAGALMAKIQQRFFEHAWVLAVPNIDFLQR